MAEVIGRRIDQAKNFLSFVVLDLMLPRLDRWEVCRRLRRTSDVPILILTAREEELDRIVGLSIGWNCEPR